MCLHEEDNGLLWKHMEYRTGYAESRRARRLVFSFVSTVSRFSTSFYLLCHIAVPNSLLILKHP